jgi:hypothetical protein
VEGRAGRKRWKVEQGGRGEGRAGRKRWKVELGGRGPDGLLLHERTG